MAARPCGCGSAPRALHRLEVDHVMVFVPEEGAVLTIVVHCWIARKELLAFAPWLIQNDLRLPVGVDSGSDQVTGVQLVVAVGVAGGLAWCLQQVAPVVLLAYNCSPSAQKCHKSYTSVPFQSTEGRAGNPCSYFAR